MPSHQQRTGKRVSRVSPGTIAIIGLGRLGSSLYAALRAAGHTPVEVVLRNKRSRNQVPEAATPTTTITTLSAARLDADLIWLCVPDAVLPEVSASIASRRSLHSQVVIHSSGVLGTSVLQPARDSGALIGSVHPLMTFPTRTPIPLIGVHFAIEAGAVLERRLTKLVQLLGGLPFSVTSRGKPLYHAAAVMASPLLVSLATATLSIAVASGLTEKQALVLLEPIMKASIHNFFKDGTASSFSGPFARGDAETVSLHLAALKEHPFQQQVYRALADYALQALPAKNRQELQRRLASVPGLYTEG